MAPNTNILRFTDELHNILETVKQTKVYMCGDYNIDLLKNMNMIKIARILSINCLVMAFIHL